jgi:hypothetical protein
MLDRSLKPWLLEVNHLPSFNHDTLTDCAVKTELIRDIFTILQMSVDNRKRVHREMRSEQKAAMLAGGFFKRLTVREHLERVRFDPTSLSKLDPSNGFKLIFPRDPALSDDNSYKYERFLRKANDIWQVTTGTVRASQLQNQSHHPLVRRKKRLKKKKDVSNGNIILSSDPALGGGGDEGVEEDGAIIEELDEEKATAAESETNAQSALSCQTVSAPPAKLSKQAIAKQVTQRLYGLA